MRILCASTPRPLAFALACAFATLLASPSGAGAAQAIVELSEVDGQSGFLMDGEADQDQLGLSASAVGDFNGDGRDDFIVAAEAAQGGRGSTYVVFGRDSAFPAALDVTMLNGLDGFRIDSDHGGSINTSGAGDFDGDSFDDLIIGLPSSQEQDGRACVVYGRPVGPAVVELDLLDAGEVTCFDAAQVDENVGRTVAGVGDLDGDGVDDIAIGATEADYAGTRSGSVYVVYGSTSGAGRSVDLDDLDGDAGYRIDGALAGDAFGSAVAAAGDVNGDGLADLVVGADSVGEFNNGAAYVLFGNAARPPGSPLSIAAMDAGASLTLSETEAGSGAGRSVAGGGDYNGDGVADVVIGARGNGSNGAAYVVFGRRDDFGAIIELPNLDATDGFKVVGEAFLDLAGDSVGNAGDLNGDGLDDFSVGAPSADPHGQSSGKAYVVFGRREPWPAIVPLATLDSDDGLVFLGTGTEDYCGLNVTRAGDVNGDFGSDLLITCHAASSLGMYRGRAYVVYGMPPVQVFADGFEH